MVTSTCISSTRFARYVDPYALALHALLVAGLLASTDARGDETPRVHHAPPSVAQANAPLAVEVSFDAPDKVKKATLVYRSSGEGAPVSVVTFERSSRSDKPYVAVIPPGDVHVPTLAYAIELETADHGAVPAFASRQHMHTVALQEDAGDARERALLTRLGGRRTTVGASGDYADFGHTPTGASDGGVVSDRFYRLEGQFTYRLLRTVAEFGFRGGVVRGSSPVDAATSQGQRNVGMNYGAPRIRLRVADWLHVDAEGLTSVNEVGYSIGGGGAVLVGDPYGTRLTLGFEAIEIFGARGFTRFDVAALRWLSIGTLVEVTNQPHANTAGVRLVADASIDIARGLSIVARGGYQARSFASGGPAAGLGVAYSF